MSPFRSIWNRSPRCCRCWTCSENAQWLPYPQANSSIEDHRHERTSAHKRLRRFLEGSKDLGKSAMLSCLLSLHLRPVAVAARIRVLNRWVRIWAPSQDRQLRHQLPGCLLVVVALGAHGPTAVPENRLMLHRPNADQAHELRTSNR